MSPGSSWLDFGTVTRGGRLPGSWAAAGCAKLRKELSRMGRERDRCTRMGWTPGRNFTPGTRGRGDCTPIFAGSTINERNFISSLNQSDLAALTLVGHA